MQWRPETDSHVQRCGVRRYLIWSYDYYQNSGGPKVLHRLCHELNQLGQTAYVNYHLRNPLWNTPYHPGPLHGNWMAVYPEIVPGNPLNAPHVARWVLNHPGKLGGTKEYDPAEEVFVFHEAFNHTLKVPPERILDCPVIETDIFYDRHLPREGELFYVGKSTKSRDLPGAREITAGVDAADPIGLADTLNRATVLYTFDNETAMAEIARLCGCPVVVIPDGSYTWEEYDRLVGWEGQGWDAMPGPWDIDAYRARYLARDENFRARLRDFIRITQA